MAYQVEATPASRMIPARAASGALTFAGGRTARASPPPARHVFAWRRDACALGHGGTAQPELYLENQAPHVIREPGDARLSVRPEKGRPNSAQSAEHHEGDKRDPCQDGQGRGHVVRYGDPHARLEDTAEGLVPLHEIESLADFIDGPVRHLIEPCRNQRLQGRLQLLLPHARAVDERGRIYDVPWEEPVDGLRQASGEA
mmetsp:Transcript_40310/g.111011  ORF Transcript_40310/g.111011 Transcript_40310/m.111011 type:complete len:200 (+) Transcript_40310:38-637(+)